MVKCLDCHFMVLFKPGKGFCMLAKQFMDRDQYTDQFVACDFFRRCKQLENIHDHSTEESDA